MRKTIIQILALLAIITLTAISTHGITMKTLCIETDGDGDSAIVKTASGYWFYGINGYEPCGGDYMEDYHGENFRG